MATLSIKQLSGFPLKYKKKTRGSNKMAAPDSVQMELNNMKIRLINVYTHFDLATNVLNKTKKLEIFFVANCKHNKTTVT